MSFNGNGTRFVGDDGYLKTATFGAEIAGDGVTALPVGIYLITNVAASSAFPAALTGSDPAAGDVIVVNTGVTITPAIDDDVVTLTLTNRCDISSWTMEFSKEEIEVTTLCDAQKVYRAGKADMSGSLNGVFEAGTTDATNGYIREFLPIIQQDGSTSMDRFTKNEVIGLGLFYVNSANNNTLADEMFVVAPYQLYGEQLGGEMGSAQSFSASFRFANLVYTDSVRGDISVEPTFHRIGE